MLGVTEISAMVAAAGVLVGVVYYVLEIRNQSRMRQTDFITRLYSTYGSKEFHDTMMELHSLQFKDFEDFVERYGPWISRGAAQTTVFVVATYFTEWGVLLRRKIVNVDFLYDIFGSTAVKVHWEKVKPIVLGIRELFGDPTVFAPFEYLYDELKKREQLYQRGVKSG